MEQYQVIYDILQMSEVVKPDHVDDALSAWMTRFVDVCNKYAPVKRRKVKRQQQPVWLSSQEKSLQRCRSETNTSHRVDGDITG